MNNSEKEMLQWQLNLWKDLDEVISSYVEVPSHEHDQCKIIDIHFKAKKEVLNQQVKCQN